MTLTEAPAPYSLTGAPEGAREELPWPPAVPETPGQVCCGSSSDRVWKITVNLDDVNDHFIEVETRKDGQVIATEDTGSGRNIDAYGLGLSPS